MIKRAGAGILSGVILAAALSCSLSGCNTVQNQTEHQTEQKTEQEVSQAAQGENQVSGIEFRLQYPQAMWQGLNLTYADYGNEEEFERKFHNAVQKITGLTGNADWYTKYNPKAVYIRVLIKIADMSYRSIGGQCDWPIVDAADGLFTTVYMDKDMQEAGQPTLEHELTHMICGETFSNSLMDGLAEYCERQVTGKSNSTFSVYPADDLLKVIEKYNAAEEEAGVTGKISLEEIMDKIGAGEKEYPYKDVSKEANHLWYIYSESFVTWLINTYGMEKVMYLYNNGQSEEDYEKLETGGYAAVKEKWKTYLSEYEQQNSTEDILAEQEVIAQQIKEIKLR